jgi:hypothetical protein
MDILIHKYKIINNIYKKEIKVVVKIHLKKHFRNLIKANLDLLHQDQKDKKVDKNNNLILLKKKNTLLIIQQMNIKNMKGMPYFKVEAII